MADKVMVPPPMYPQPQGPSFPGAPGNVPPQQPSYPHQGGYPHQAPMPQAVADMTAIGEQYRAGLMAQCASGVHDLSTKYGVCGIITAILCFPIGLVALVIDRETRCARCGVRIA